jgi:IS30 family transposase
MRGINENSNRLIRQYLPKDTDFNKVTGGQVQFKMDRLNSRPGMSWGGSPQNELFKGPQDDLLAA